MLGGLADVPRGTRLIELAVRMFHVEHGDWALADWGRGANGRQINTHPPISLILRGLADENYPA
jgi:hypothetical protein